RTADAFDRTIDVQVSRLRHRLDGAGSAAAALIKTVRNAGYILAAPVGPQTVPVRPQTTPAKGPGEA
ncbi:winged helix-turn-helix domain-containing protein, partial [Methylobacterium indicum]